MIPWSMEPQWSQKVGVKYEKVSHLCLATAAWQRSKHETRTPKHLHSVRKQGRGRGEQGVYIVTKNAEEKVGSEKVSTRNIEVGAHLILASVLENRMRK